MRIKGWDRVVLFRLLSGYSSNCKNSHESDSDSFHLTAEVKVSSAIRPHLLLDSSVPKALQAKALTHVTEDS